MKAACFWADAAFRSVALDGPQVPTSARVSGHEHVGVRAAVIHHGTSGSWQGLLDVTVTIR